MDKYEYKVRSDEIKALVAEGDFAEAAAIADTIDWRRVKSVMMLCTISDIYKINRRYEESKEILLLAYEKHPGGRLIIYSLCELSLKLGEFVQAIEYYKEFVQAAPRDYSRYILQYKIYEAQEVSLEERIAVLEEFKKKDYREKWAYELARLYHSVGLVTRCMEECDEICVWFGKGRYVTKALELKQLHTPLTDEQIQRLEEAKRNDSVHYQYDSDTQVYSASGEEAYESRSQRYEKSSAEEEFFSEETFKEEGYPAEEGYYTEEEYTGEVPVDRVFSGTSPVEGGYLEDGYSMGDESLPDGNTKEYPFVGNYEVAAGSSEEIDIRIKPVDVSQYNTLNLQRELAESMKVFLSDVPESDGPDRAKANEKSTLSKKTEVFFNESRDTEELVFEGLNLTDYERNQMGSSHQTVKNTETVSNEVKVSPQSFTNTGIIKTFTKPSGYDKILTQEYDGQISLVVPEEEKIERQITGQLKIGDILAEWERQKKEIEQKRMQEVRNKVRKQTNVLFSEFDEATKTGLLEKLEKAMIDAVMRGGESKNHSPGIIKVADINADLPLKEQIPSEKQMDEEVARLLSADHPETVPEETEDIPNEEQLLTDSDRASEEDGSQESTDAVKESAHEKKDAAEDNLSQKPNKKVLKKLPKTAEKAEAAITDIQMSSVERELNDDEKARFGRFVYHKKSRRQLIHVIDNISMAAYTGNVIITAEEEIAAIQVAKGLIKGVQQSDHNFSGKVAKISGNTLNKKDLAATFSNLENGAIIIEKVSRMNADRVKKLVKMLEQESTGYIVFLEDIKANIESFLTKFPEMTKLFNLRIDLEGLNDKLLVECAKRYAEELEYTIDEFGVLALHTRIEEMQTIDHEVTVAEVQEMIDEAIYYADRKNPKHFFDILIGKRYDNEDMVILREKDFMH